MNIFLSLNVLSVHEKRVKHFKCLALCFICTIHSFTIYIHLGSVNILSLEGLKVNSECVGCFRQLKCVIM